MPTISDASNETSTGRSSSASSQEDMVSYITNAAFVIMEAMATEFMLEVSLQNRPCFRTLFDSERQGPLGNDFFCWQIMEMLEEKYTHFNYLLQHSHVVDYESFQKVCSSVLLGKDSADSRRQVVIVITFGAVLFGRMVKGDQGDAAHNAEALVRVPAWVARFLAEDMAGEVCDVVPEISPMKSGSRVRSEWNRGRSEESGLSDSSLADASISMSAGSQSNVSLMSDSGNSSPSVPSKESSIAQSSVTTPSRSTSTAASVAHAEVIVVDSFAVGEFSDAPDIRETMEESVRTSRTTQGSTESAGKEPVPSSRGSQNRPASMKTKGARSFQDVSQSKSQDVSSTHQESLEGEVSNGPRLLNATTVVGIAIVVAAAVITISILMRNRQK